MYTHKKEEEKKFEKEQSLAGWSFSTITTKGTNDTVDGMENYCIMFEGTRAQPRLMLVCSENYWHLLIVFSYMVLHLAFKESNGFGKGFRFLESCPLLSKVVCLVRMVINFEVGIT